MPFPSLVGSLSFTAWLTDPLSVDKNPLVEIQQKIGGSGGIMQ
jgi:hypothetical protein